MECGGAIGSERGGLTPSLLPSHAHCVTWDSLLGLFQHLRSPLSHGNSFSSFRNGGEGAGGERCWK